MNIIGVIPARWGATRFPGKVLADLHGKPVIQHVWQQAKKASKLSEVIIACDDDRVQQACEAFGARTVMTAAQHPSGTDRIVEAVGHIDADIVVNVQGDEPLIPPSVIDQLAEALVKDADCPMATVIKQLTNEEDAANPNIVKAVVDCHGYALYFSRYAIPFNRDEKEFSQLSLYKHLGLYAYRRDFLMRFHDLPVSILEQTEKLEQLRVLEAGYRIKTVLTDMETIGVDTPEDLERIHRLFDGEKNG